MLGHGKRDKRVGSCPFKLVKQYKKSWIQINPFHILHGNNIRLNSPLTLNPLKSVSEKGSHSATIAAMLDLNDENWERIN